MTNHCVKSNTNFYLNNREEAVRSLHEKYTVSSSTFIQSIYDPVFAYHELVKSLIIAYTDFLTTYCTL